MTLEQFLAFIAPFVKWYFIVAAVWALLMIVLYINGRRRWAKHERAHEQRRAEMLRDKWR